jgi:hypothetical protein
MTRLQFWLLTLLGAAALVVVSVNIFTMMANADLRTEVNQRQQFINQSVKLGRLHKQLIQGLANLSARSGDEELRQVLARHGIEFTVSKSATPPSGKQTGAVQTPAATNTLGETGNE